MPAIAEDPNQRIAKLVLAEQGRIRLSPTVENERKAALVDLLQDNHFRPCNGLEGPYVVHLALEGEHATFTVFDDAGHFLTRFSFPIIQLRRVIKDYFMICDSYFSAIRTMPPSRIEAIDMGRRGLHNEGAELLRDRIAEYVEVDMNTARRLFTLLCVLHIRR